MKSNEHTANDAAELTIFYDRSVAFIFYKKDDFLGIIFPDFLDNPHNSAGANTGNRNWKLHVKSCASGSLDDHVRYSKFVYL